MVFMSRTHGGEDDEMRRHTRSDSAACSLRIWGKSYDKSTVPLFFNKKGIKINLASSRMF